VLSSFRGYCSPGRERQQSVNILPGASNTSCDTIAEEGVGVHSRSSTTATRVESMMGLSSRSGNRLSFADSSARSRSDNESFAVESRTVSIDKKEVTSRGGSKASLRAVLMLDTRSCDLD